MARGISLHFAVSKPPDSCCEKSTLVSAPRNAETMVQIAHDYDFEVRDPLLNDAAKSGEVLKALASAAKEVTSGDLLLVTFAGHGCQVNGVPPHDEPMDQAWCLADRKFLDDELGRAFEDFEKGVRILVVSESCHSASMAQLQPPVGKRASARRPVHSAAYQDRIRLLAARWGVEECRKLVLRGRPGNRIKASVMVLSACEDPRTANESNGETLFTPILERVLRSSEHQTYCGLMKEVRRQVSNQADQRPCFTFAGIPSKAFAAQKPFTI